jgi:hypothetical protein
VQQATGVRLREEVTMRRVQVFDVNETLLDLAAMDPHFQRIFGDAAVRRSWFTQMISPPWSPPSPAPTTPSAPTPWPPWR